MEENRRQFVFSDGLLDENRFFCTENITNLPVRIKETIQLKFFSAE